MNFHQNGAVATLHNLTRRSVEDLEAALMQFAQQHPMALMLPSLYSELAAPAWLDLISGVRIEDLDGEMTLATYQAVWLTNKV